MKTVETQTETPDEFRVVARVDSKTKRRVEAAAKNAGLSGSDLLRLSLLKFLPELEAGKISLAKKTA